LRLICILHQSESLRFPKEPAITAGSLLCLLSGTGMAAPGGLKAIAAWA